MTDLISNLNLWLTKPAPQDIALRKGTTSLKQTGRHQHLDAALRRVCIILSKTY